MIPSYENSAAAGKLYQSEAKVMGAWASAGPDRKEVQRLAAALSPGLLLECSSPHEEPLAPGMTRGEVAAQVIAKLDALEVAEIQANHMARLAETLRQELNGIESTIVTLGAAARTIRARLDELTSGRIGVVNATVKAAHECVMGQAIPVLQAQENALERRKARAKKARKEAKAA